MAEVDMAPERDQETSRPVNPNKNDATVTPLAQTILRTQQDIAFALGAIRTNRPRGAGLERLDRLNSEDDAVTDTTPTPSGWRPSPGMARSKIGPGPSRYDPRSVSSLLDNFLETHRDKMRDALIRVKWAEAVGEQIANHTNVVAVDGDRVVVEASSTSWATALQMQLGTVLRRLEEECGKNIVKTVIVRGPSAHRSWKHGPRSVPGRGVRDTYG